MTVDLNCDMGELADAALEEALMPHITSANIACGGHAGDEATMERTVRLALTHTVQIGAHPGYPDRANFGRVPLAIAEADLERSILEQIERLAAVVESCGAAIRHVKPHGALYNVAVKDEAVAAVIARAVARWNRDVSLVGLARSRMLEVWRAAGFHTAAEGFADRAYQPDGTLRPRSQPGALLTDPAAAAEQALALAGWTGETARPTAGNLAPSGRGGTGRWPVRRVDTICVHSDTPHAVEIARAVARKLRESGITPAATRIERRLS